MSTAERFLRAVRTVCPLVGMLLASCTTTTSGGSVYSPGSNVFPSVGEDSGSTDDAGATATTDGGGRGSCLPACNSKSCSDGCGGDCPDLSPCDDGSLCSKEDRCLLGTCIGASFLDCDDGNACTKEVCSPEKGCVTVPDDFAACSDGNPCTKGDVCLSGKCDPGEPFDCNSGEAICTLGACDPKQGCSFTVAPDGTSCGAGGQCFGGSCCECPAGSKCNAIGECVKKESCYGSCGEYQADWACQCDAECAKYGDCCADYTGACQQCGPEGVKICKGDVLASFDTCGKQISQDNCAFGCKDGACKSDPCGGISEFGECSGTAGYFYCATTTGDGAQPTLKYEACSSWSTCKDTGIGAWCAAKPESCTPGQSQCAPGKPNMQRTCNKQGAWEESPCAGCAPTYLANLTACPGGVGLQATTFTISYDHVLPYSDYSGYAENQPKTFAPLYLLALAVRYDVNFEEITLFDANTVKTDGSLTLDVPTSPTAYDYVLLLTYGYDDKTGSARFAVLEPAVQDGEVEVSSDNPLTGKPYGWAKELASLLSVDNKKWHISYAEKSWALQVFDRIRYDSLNADFSMWGKPGLTLAVWLRDGTDFSCGACFAPWPTEGEPLGGVKAQSQIWISSSAKTYLSRAVLDHEMGHWAMASYGKSPGEGGTHFVNTKVPAGMAWSEGWATFFSSMSRGSGVYYDQGGNGMFWLDLGKAVYGGGAPLKPFDANDGLVQFMDENRVAAALWQAADHAEEPFKSPKNAAFWLALASKQMNGTTFTRPYYRQIWDDDIKPCAACPYGVNYTGLESTTIQAPTFPAYLDALLCTAPSLKWSVAASTSPLPFPFDAPLCP